MTVTEPIFRKLALAWQLNVNYFCTEFHKSPTRLSRLFYVTEGRMDLASTLGRLYLVENAEINLFMLRSGTIAVWHGKTRKYSDTCVGKMWFL